MTSHLEALLQQDLEQIRSKVVEMGELAERAIRPASGRWSRRTASSPSP